MPERRQISSGGPWEEQIGYSRAVVDGDWCWVSGTTDAGPNRESLHPFDAAAQARAVWEIIERALSEAGFSLNDVVRTRTYVTSIDDMTAVGLVHGELFREVRPAATLVQVAGLAHPSIVVEIEAEARRPSS
ncbi:MAG TPA: RidA family protein [Candidatus Limnocylindrales bacterium]|nr:RidA family protein [Candidatus Limnocylindrales bacterium]